MSARRVFRTLASFGVLLVPTLALAQTGTVTGTVTESRANAPVGGARVQALTATTVVAATQSRDDGTFRLTIAPGTYTIVVNRIGYRPGNGSVTVTAGGTATANIVLPEAVVELNPVVTVASRKEEKALDAPASVSVVEVRAITERPTVTTAGHVEGLAGVDVSKGGIAQANVVARGFNNIFSGSLLMLQDYRFAGVPSLRVNVPLLSTSTNEDIERIEVLLGPASALYGPNSSHGVVHTITKSPFTSQGGILTVDGGTHSLFRASGRYAGLAGDKVGFKLSGEYFTASDFEFTDPGEPTNFPAAAPPGRAGQPNARDFSVGRWVGEGRLDWRPNDNSEFVTTYGTSTILDGLEYTGANGAAQAKNWQYQSFQQRARIGRFFAQAFLNTSDAGNKDSLDLGGTFLLRSGQPIVDQSKSWAAQVQHGLALGSSLDFVYGLDYISTNPRTGNTINGRNEDVDDVKEVGGYVQGTWQITPHFDFLGALRLDNNDQVEGWQTSPRAALIWKPNETSNLRFTYNRAFQTPANFTWFLDLIQARNLGGSPYNIRALGNPPKKGWTFNRSCDASVNGGLCMRTIFTGTAGESVWQPSSATVGYRGAIAANAPAISSGLSTAFTAALQAPPFGLPPAQAAAVAAGLATNITTYLGTLQPTPGQVSSEMRMILPGSSNLAPTDVTDLAPIKASFNNTYEVGYKGIIGSKLRLAVDLWHEKRGDVGNPAGLTTPNIFFNRTSLQSYMTTSLVPAITASLMGPPFNMSQAQAAAVAAQFAPQIAGQVAPGLSALPVGIVSFNDDKFASARDVFATYTTNDKTITVNGIDLAADYVANNSWSFAATYSWVDNDQWPEVTSSNNLPLMLNAPTDKSSLTATYRSTSGSWGADARLRFTNAYPVNSGVYATDVDFTLPGAAGTYRYDDITTATVFDVGVNWRLQPASRSMLISARLENLFDDKYRTMPGLPLLGFMFVTRLQYSF
ncbi:MAG TPA: TonB-dependent receptor [Gemmatimonadaceae bacterium]|nr:TonB-dependent receptor [Gemmatimonadaceae bacterium]